MSKCSLVLFLIVLLVSCTEKPKYLDSNIDIEERVDDLLGRMTLEEKIEQLGGTGFDTKVNERFNIPLLKMTDGPVGVRWGQATALPAAVALASTWDRELIYEVGQLLGRETSAKGRNILLGPCVNIHRFPVGGRNFESFGEDPYLAGQIAVPYIKGVQSQKVIACVKHYACNNQEWNRSSVNAVVDERTLHEIYLPAFKTAVQEGNVWSVMTSYNKVNGFWTSENNHLLNNILKKEWGFKGFVVSDWGASHSTVGSVNAGLDLEMPYGTYMNDSLISLEMKKNTIVEETINDKLRRLLRIRFQAEMSNRESKPDEGILKSDEHKKIAYQAALNGMVLLKNEGNILPIEKDKIKSIAAIGPNAAFPRIGGGGSSKVQPFYAVSPLQALQNKLGNSVKINYALGTIIKGDIQIIENKYFTPRPDKNGLKAEYFNNIDLSGKPLFQRTDKEVNFLWYYDAPRWDLHGANDDNLFSVRWTGSINPPVSGKYKFQVMHNDGVRLKLNKKIIIDKWNDHRKSRIDETEIYLNSSEEYEVVLEYYNNAGVSEIKLGWEIPNQNLLDEAVSLAKNSDIAVVFAGLSDHFEGEGRDRDFLILENQDRLIKAVQKINPNTIVVMISGTPPIMESWADDVLAILQAWFGGQEGGNAIADILLGNANPSGKLPCSFYKEQADSPGFDDYRNENLISNYTEGIYVGYRYLDKYNITPRFAFGHGLSYSKFIYKSPVLKKTGDHKYELKFTLSNVSEKDGFEVAQIYLSPVKHSIERPLKELKAFEKIFLESMESKEIVIYFDEKDFSYYNVNNSAWEIDKGKYNILIGSSSDDIRQTVSLNTLED